VGRRQSYGVCVPMEGYMYILLCIYLFIYVLSVYTPALFIVYVSPGGRRRMTWVTHCLLHLSACSLSLSLLWAVSWEEAEDGTSHCVILLLSSRWACMCSVDFSVLPAHCTRCCTLCTHLPVPTPHFACPLLPRFCYHLPTPSLHTCTTTLPFAHTCLQPSLSYVQCLVSCEIHVFSVDGGEKTFSLKAILLKEEYSMKKVKEEEGRGKKSVYIYHSSLLSASVSLPYRRKKA